jgi:hypothetical protein
MTWGLTSPCLLYHNLCTVPVLWATAPAQGAVKETPSVLLHLHNCHIVSISLNISFITPKPLCNKACRLSVAACCHRTLTHRSYVVSRSCPAIMPIALPSNGVKTLEHSKKISSFRMIQVLVFCLKTILILYAMFMKFVSKFNWWLFAGVTSTSVTFCKFLAWEDLWNQKMKCKRQESDVGERLSSLLLLSGAFATKGCKNAPISFALSVCPSLSLCPHVTTLERLNRIFMKFDVCQFY